VGIQGRERPVSGIANLPAPAEMKNPASGRAFQRKAEVKLNGLLASPKDHQTASQQRQG
jgi:hypothetical protein